MNGKKNAGDGGEWGVRCAGHPAHNGGFCRRLNPAAQPRPTAHSFTLAQTFCMLATIWATIWPQLIRGIKKP